MIYGGDKYGDIPVMKLFSEPIMQASIAAAKDLYDQGIKRADDNAKTYGDFFSPISKDVDFWYNNTMQPVNKGLDWMARNGISPDSAEGRSIMSRIISNVPASQLATIKQSAEAAKQYQKNAAILRASGKYSQAFEDFVHGGKNLNNWDTSKDGAWTDTSPYEYETLSEYAGKPLEGIAEISLTPDQAKSIFGSAYKPGHNYTGVTRDMAATAFANWEAGVAGTPLYDFYKYQTRQRLQKAGALDNLTPDQQDALVDKQFTKEALDATVKHWNKYHDLGMTDEAKAAMTFKYDMAKQRDQQAFERWKVQTTENGANYRAQLAAGSNGSGGSGSGGTSNQAAEDFIAMLKQQSTLNKDQKGRMNWRDVRWAQIQNLRDEYHRVDMMARYPKTEWQRTHKQQLLAKRKQLGKMLITWKSNDKGQGLIDANGNPTKLYYTAYNDLLGKGYLTNGGKQYIGSANNDPAVRQWMNDNLGGLLGTAEAGYVNKFMAPAGRVDKYGNSDGSYMYFGDSNTRWTAPKVHSMFGTRYTTGSNANKFEKWLEGNRIQVFIPNGSGVRVGTAGTAGRSGTNFILSRDGYITDSDFDAWLIHKGYMTTSTSDKAKPAIRASEANKLGISHTNVGGKGAWRIPVINTVSESQINNMWITNAQVYKDLYGQDFNKNYALTEQARAMDPMVR